MREEIKYLESLDRDNAHTVLFNNGDELELIGFDRVDESIYDRDDLVVATVVTQLKCDPKFFKPGTMIEFSLADVVSVDGLPIPLE